MTKQYATQITGPQGGRGVGGGGVVSFGGVWVVVLGGN